MTKYIGKVWRVGDDIDTDLIIAARYLNDASEENLKKHCLEDVIPDFIGKIQKGDILVAGKNFGCGSSREHAPLAIKAAGISCVVAQSFARIFYRNAINIGLPIITSEEAVWGISTGDRIEVDVNQGYIFNMETGEEYETETFPPFIQEIIKAGNLLNYVKNRVKFNG
ncbi:MAG: 3-isopropylmalate/(R)-2-methylmalate dehydratase small subunit [Clostridia bacterium]|jgi:3-isopropylmalate dehydratase small subunit|nr:3-isopropylmalate/(R)-2-methylmalate dehydratase small subunit [Clostridia bacterium]MDN5323637.1 3-isopropylmalate/(R)-2-methylmalate dehydratase small subunit [Clostridia bacterium]